MPAVAANVLLDEVKCYACAVGSAAQLLKLALLRRNVLAANPSADVSLDGLMEYSKCYACFGFTQYELLELALLSQATGGGSGDCENLEGIASPLNSITPDFIGQVYVQSDGTIWQAGSLLSSSWAVICDGANDSGLIWGPTPETVDSIDGTGESFSPSFFPADSYTEFSFGNPVTVTNNLDFNGSTTYTAITFRLLTTVGGQLNASSCSVLVGASFPLLTTVTGGIFFGSCTLLTMLNFPLLTLASDIIDIAGSGLTALSLPSLTTYPPSGINAAGATLLNLSLPVCTDDGAGQLNADLNSMTGLVTLNLNSVVTITTGPTLSASSGLTTFTASAWLPTDGNTIDFNGCALDATSVNQILARCVAAGVTTCTIDLSGGTNAAPTGQGIIDAADLATAGNTVSTN